ncbi:MAG: hypothetical protein IPK72_17705 [Candidatus Eisenbacteria bacterium]|nr:hypothetical protein [Candidatus Eisenbacteria bacterium]
MEDAFQDRFGAPLPETLNERHRLLIVASRVDPSSERIVRYLSATHGVDINAATFHYYRQKDGPELLARLFLIAPEQVARRSQSDGQSKRRPNLTFDELSALAASNGVAQLFERAVAAFCQYFQTHTNRSSLVFSDKRKAVLSLIPGDSSPATGLRFRIYIRRLQAAFSLPEAAALAALPDARSPWIYYETAGPEYEGFEGYFASGAEITRLAAVMAGSEQKAA